MINHRILQDEPELKFFDDVYTTWDDKNCCKGGRWNFLIARRKGEEWFIGSITNNEKRVLSVNPVLPEGK